MELRGCCAQVGETLLITAKPGQICPGKSSGVVSQGLAAWASSMSGGENHLVDLVDEVAEVEGLGEDLGILGRL